MRLIDADALSRKITEEYHGSYSEVQLAPYEVDAMIEAQPTVGQWIPCSERLPDDYHAVNVTWVNRSPEPYYMHIKNKPFTATACYHNRSWYWYSSVIEDLIAEYDGDPLAEIDDGIEIIAWQPLPEPYREGK